MARGRKRKRTATNEDCNKDINPATEICDRSKQLQRRVLCHVCSEVNFNLIFRSRCVVPQKLCGLREMLKNRQCRFCTLIFNAAEERVYNMKLHEFDERRVALEDMISQRKTYGQKYDFVCVIRLRASDPALYLRRNGIAGEYRAGVRLQLTTNGSPSAGYPDMWILLDRLEHPKLIAGHLDFMARRPLSRRPFEPETLRLWLAESETANIRHRPILEELVNSGRFRLIDVRSGVIHKPTQQIVYVALSYVWGQTMTRYLQSLQQAPHVDLKSLPRTLRDAVALVRDVGESYLWVDAVCIDQIDAADVHENISSMSAIYEAATFTIIAADGKDADNGLLRLEHTAGKTEHPASIPQQDSNILLLPTRGSLEQQLRMTEWNSRAWTFQERSLSKRCVIFTKDEVLFQCSEFEARECYELMRCHHKSRKSGSERKRLRTQRREDFYQRLGSGRGLTIEYYIEAVEQYARRKLTYSGDRLDAFTGILANFHPPGTSRAQLRLMSGLLPGAAFYRTLLWTFKPAVDDPRFHECSFSISSVRVPHDQRRTRHLPSWSWVGWDWEVTFLPSTLRVSSDVQQPKIIDAANLACNLADAPWEGAQALSEVETPLCVVLHVWAPAVLCHAIYSYPDSPAKGGMLRLNVAPHEVKVLHELGRGFQQPYGVEIHLGKYALMHTEGVEDDLDLYLISLEKVARDTFMLVRGCLPHVERLGVFINDAKDGANWPRNDFASWANAKYFQIR